MRELMEEGGMWLTQERREVSSRKSKRMTGEEGSRAHGQGLERALELRTTTQSSR